MVFSELNLKTELKKCIEQANYFTLTKIQEKLIPLIINNKDVVAKAPTGTGKTASFVIPIINEISLNKTLQTVVLVPTRELCVQITNEFRRLSKGLNKLFIASIYGGQKSSIQLKLLHASPQIIVATPGRLIDFMENNHIHIKNIKTLVIDEVDQMFNLGFSKDVEWIVSHINSKCQTIFLSATMDNKILNLSKKIQLNPIYISIEPETTSKPKIEQFFIEVTPKNKEKMLINLIKSKNFYSCIVFANTKAKVKELSRKLINNKINCAAIHGELEQSMRDMIMKKFKSGRIQTLIATDIVARGIDINNLEAVINYDIPEDIEYYIHRIGRTGRADASGESYIFMLKSDTKDIKKIEDATKTKLHKYEIQNL